MENSEKINMYEIMLIVDANLANDKKDAIVKAAEGVIAKNGGEVNESTLWMEKHTLTFEIKHCKEGSYYLVKFKAEGSMIAGIQETLRLKDDILRYSITKLDPKQIKKEVAQ